MRKLALATIAQLFPLDSLELTEPQRKQVKARIESETKPAAIFETVYSALNEATGATTASNKVNGVIERQEMVGGGYKDGELPRKSDEKAILDMWERVRAFIKREYSGYQVDGAGLVPSRPIILTASEGCFSIGGEVSIGFKNP